MTFDESFTHGVRSGPMIASRSIPSILWHVRSSALGAEREQQPTSRFIAVTDRVKIERLAKEPWACYREPVGPPSASYNRSCAQLDIVTNKIAAGLQHRVLPDRFWNRHGTPRAEATELGLGTCGSAGSIRNARDRYWTSRQRPVMSMVSVGYAADTPPRKRSRKPLRKLLFSESWAPRFPIPTQVTRNRPAAIREVESDRRRD